MEKKQSADCTNMRESKKNAICGKELVASIKAISMLESDTANSHDAYCIVDCRVYMSRHSDGASPQYCNIWITDDIRANESGHSYARGVGKASGYGYDKTSAAIGDAIADAGIVLSKRIDGVGESATKEAICAICETLGYADGEYAIVRAWA